MISQLSGDFQSNLATNKAASCEQGDPGSPERRTTQHEHAAAQMSIAVKMGDAFWYATCLRCSI